MSILLNNKIPHINCVEDPSWYYYENYEEHIKPEASLKAKLNFVANQMALMGDQGVEGYDRQFDWVKNSRNFPEGLEWLTYEIFEVIMGYGNQ